MKIKILAVGKLKEDYLKAGVAEYMRRLRLLTAVEIVEIPDESIPDKASEKEKHAVKSREGAKILTHVAREDKLVALCLDGELLTSEELAADLKVDEIYGQRTLIFAIGGSLGLSEEVIARATLRLSFGRMTLPHQLMRLVLLEQIYRVQMINRGSTYHK